MSYFLPKGVEGATLWGVTLKNSFLDSEATRQSIASESSSDMGSTKAKTAICHARWPAQADKLLAATSTPYLSQRLDSRHHLKMDQKAFAQLLVSGLFINEFLEGPAFDEHAANHLSHKGGVLFATGREF